VETTSSKLRIGDRVEVRTISFQGTGTITEISSVFSRGYGTKLYPSFLVEMDDQNPIGFVGLSEWYNGISLFKIKD
jgi:hypothetical protein